MRTNTRHKQTLVLSFPERRLNLARITELQNRLHPLVTQPDQEIILDLRHVLWIDCSAVGCLVSMNQLALANRSRLVLTNLTGNVQLLADTLNLSEIINIVNTEKTPL
ncbi:MAG: STAS domain-containing protein [Odoribacter sp.]|nr:STAS domain-containing protein [Odoribacter sp.]